MPTIVSLKGPKYFALNCKYLAPSMTYEHYLIEVLNGSLCFFMQKRTRFEQFQLVEKQDHSEPDAKSSLYSIDFKLLVDQEVMNAMSKNRPSIDHSHEKEGIIIVKEKRDKIPVPQNNPLFDLIDLKESDIEGGNYSKTVGSLLVNLKKGKNLFFFYPYQFSTQEDVPAQAFEGILNKTLKTVMDYRVKEQPEIDTFICIKANQWFLIYEWTSDGFVFRDKAHEILCGNYMNTKKNHCIDTSKHNKGSRP